MKYMGSKRRIAKFIIPIMEKARVDGQCYVEPFVGGANVIEGMSGRRIGGDNNMFVVALLKKLQEGWVPPDINEEFYKQIKAHPSTYADHVVGYAATQLTFGSKWFDSYSRDRQGIRDYSSEAKRNVLNQAPKLKNIEFVYSDYKNLEFPGESLIYCDPPYKGATRYGLHLFNTSDFWIWCEYKVMKGHTVYVSEYTAPECWESIWEKELVSSLTEDTGSKKAIEKLFVFRK